MSRTPVYEQLVEQIEQLVLIGLLEPEEQLPSVRQLSIELSINPNTIQKAYSELDRRGLLFSVPGKGCFVSKNLENALSARRDIRLKDLRELVIALKVLGLSKEELLKLVGEAYDTGLI